MTASAPRSVRASVSAPLRGAYGCVLSLLLALALALILAYPASAASRARLPPAFFGIDAAGLLFDGRVDLATQLAAIRSAGNGSIRLPVYWGDAQPYRSWSNVPANERSQFASAGGRPTTFGQIDEEMLEFARHGLRTLPVIVQAPTWARLQADRLWSPPAQPADYGRFVGLMVSRYGTRGTFWRQYPQLAYLAPRWWQIWNEPAGGTAPEAGTVFWDGPKPYEPRYLAMLRAARRAARAADPHARIVLAGLFGRSWDALAGIYKYGGRGSFDAVAVHPYANTPAHVLTILRYVRQTMLRHRDARLPLLVTETGWTSSAGHASSAGLFGIATTEAGQASNLAAEYPLLVAHRGELNLQGIYWYTWIGAEPNTDPFEYAGLLRLTAAGQVQAKPAYASYRRALRAFER